MQQEVAPGPGGSSAEGQASVFDQANSKEELLDRFLHSENHTNDLVNILLSEDLTKTYCGLIGPYQRPTDTNASPQLRLARGCLFFLLMHHAATMPADQRSPKDINEIVKDPDFLAIFTKLYEIPEDVGLETLAFHAAGTTSIIFSAGVNVGKAALKVLQAQYVSVRAVRDATERYRGDHAQDAVYSPKIFDRGSFGY